MRVSGAWLGNLLSDLANGHCQTLVRQGLNDIRLRHVLANLVNNRAAWPTIAPFLYRLRRCDAADVAAVAHYLNVYVPTLAPPHTDNLQRRPSWLLERHVVFGELTLASPPTEAELVSRFFAQRVTPAADIDLALFRRWPRYPSDPANHQWASASVPVLILQGELDPATPFSLARAVQTQPLGSPQYFVAFPRTPHVALIQSVMGNGHRCGEKIARAFLENPAQAPDTTCLSQLAPIDYAAAQVNAGAVFGTSTAW